MKREIVLDTETTGLKPEDGNRIVEIACVELIDGQKTGRVFQKYINPERESEPGAFAVHGLTTEFLKDKPKFNEIVDEFIEFIRGSDLVIHNSRFDVKMINAEFDKINKGSLWGYITNITDTLELDRRLFPKERKHSLDAICERFGISLEDRTLHGALIDTQLLADVYIEINKRFSKEDIEADLEQKNWVRAPVKRFNIELPKVKTTDADELQHTQILADIQKSESVEPVFLKSTNSLKI